MTYFISLHKSACFNNISAVSYFAKIMWRWRLCFQFIYLTKATKAISAPTSNIAIMQSMVSANHWVYHKLKVSFVCSSGTLSHYHVQTILKIENAFGVHSASCLSKIRSTLSVISYAMYGAAFFQFTHSPVNNCEISVSYLVIIIEVEIWIISHCF